MEKFYRGKLSYDVNLFTVISYDALYGQQLMVKDKLSNGDYLFTTCTNKEPEELEKEYLKESVTVYSLFNVVKERTSMVTNSLAPNPSETKGTLTITGEYIFKSY